MFLMMDELMLTVGIIFILLLLLCGALAYFLTPPVEEPFDIDL